MLMFLFISMIKHNHPLLWRGTLFGVFYGIVTCTFDKLVFWELPTKRGNALPLKLTCGFPLCQGLVDFGRFGERFNLKGYLLLDRNAVFYWSLSGGTQHGTSFFFPHSFREL